jgi:PilZ domain
MSDAIVPFDGDRERRRAPRAGLRLSATVREPGRGRVGVRVIDISTHGCRIEAQSGASPDTWVMLSIAGLDTQYSRIVWRAHEFAGLEFATPLAEPVLERLLQDQSQLSEQSIGELRDIANRTHRLGTVGTGKDSETLVELSSKCAADAVVEALRLGEARHTSQG